MHLKILGQTIKKNDVAVWIIRLDRNGKFAIPNTKSGAKRNLYVLNGSNMEVKNQSIVALLGGNGTGKSTILKACSGII